RRRHAHAIAFLDGQSEAPRPRADGMTPTVHHDDRTRPPECPRAFSDPFRTIELVAADLDDAHRQHASPAVSGSPSITFMFWIAWPAAPFTRLSIAAMTVRRGRRTPATSATPIATRVRYTTSLRDRTTPCTPRPPAP